MRKNIALNKEEVVSKILKSLSDTDYSFVNFDGNYVNSRSKVLLNCLKHGNWSVAIRHVTSTKSGCPDCGHVRCSSKKAQTIDIVTDKVKNRCKSYSYNFHGFKGAYKNRKSLLLIECPLHGVYQVNINNFIDNQKKCPGCKRTGFNPSKIGYLYALRSKCGCFVKVGVTNKPSVRFSTLRRATPFEFDVIENVCFEDGKDAWNLEKIFHNTFSSANLNGFDGCTEWLKWSSQIQAWFRFL